MRITLHNPHARSLTWCVLRYKHSIITQQTRARPQDDNSLKIAHDQHKKKMTWFKGQKLFHNQTTHDMYEWVLYLCVAGLYRDVPRTTTHVHSNGSLPLVSPQTFWCFYTRNTAI